MKKNIVLIGGAGAPNYGDELIVRGWLKFFGNHAEECNITFYENLAENSRKLHDQHATGKNRIQFQDDLVQVAKSYVGINFWEQIIRGYTFIEKRGLEKYAGYQLTPLLEADIIHLHGGGYLNNYDPEKGFYIGLLAALKEKHGTEIFATGIGFGPVPVPGAEIQGVIHDIFKQFRLFELRDVDNFRFLKKTFGEAAFHYGLDDCYLLSTGDLFQRDETGPRLYLSYLSYNISQASERYWDRLKKFSEKFEETIFWESYPWQDKEVFTYLKKKLPNLKKLEVKDALDHKVKIGSKDFVICSRFHVHFVLARAGLHGIYMKDSKYYDIKHQSIVDRGSTFTVANFSSSAIVNKGKIFDSPITVCDMSSHESKLELSKRMYSLCSP
ncbi:polysaccharide pyruvyl transferase family protein [Salinicola corii]|uniref:Polysaccharide pyruvyl transferase family protein n=1 Tax=Salinicola corii TaxID=2606937 RepID=A0A640WD76_9GAMM|nr:polysaccharide pyruvyl transferase family protein [Salinicola corii]KAA0017496.1 polysaccharide pyruvyl transferase family protein [Salinicola corii]